MAKQALGHGVSRRAGQITPATIIEEVEEACHVSHTRAARIMDDIEGLSSSRHDLITRNALLRQLSLPDYLSEPLVGLVSTETPSATPLMGKNSSGTSAPKRTGATLRRVPQSVVRLVESSVLMPLMGGPEGSKLAEEGGGGPGGPDRLQRTQLDPRLFTRLLVSLRSTEPALYRAVLTHPLVSGRHLSRREGSAGASGAPFRKKKRKDTERSSSLSAGVDDSSDAGGVQGGKGAAEVPSGSHVCQDSSGSLSSVSEAPRVSSESSLSAAAQSVDEKGSGSVVELQHPSSPGEVLDPLTLERHVAVLVAKAAADGSLQSLLIAVKVLLCCFVGGDDVAPDVDGGGDADNADARGSEGDDHHGGCGAEESLEESVLLPLGAVLGIMLESGALQSVNPFAHHVAAARRQVSRRADRPDLSSQLSELANSSSPEEAPVLLEPAAEEFPPTPPLAVEEASNRRENALKERTLLLSRLRHHQRERALRGAWGGDREGGAGMESDLLAHALSLSFDDASSGEAFEGDVLTEASRPRTPFNLRHSSSEMSAAEGDDGISPIPSPVTHAAVRGDSRDLESNDSAADLEAASIFRLKDFFAFDEFCDTSPVCSIAGEETSSSLEEGSLSGKKTYLSYSAAAPDTLEDVQGMVPVESVILTLLAHLDSQCDPSSLDAEGTSQSPALAIHPHPVSFMLLHSLLAHLLLLHGRAETALGDTNDPASESRKVKQPVKGPRGRLEHCLRRRLLFLSACMSSVLRVLQANLSRTSALHMSPGIVGLGSSVAVVDDDKVAKTSTIPSSPLGGRGRSLSTGSTALPALFVHRMQDLVMGFVSIGSKGGREGAPKQRLPQLQRYVDAYDENMKMVRSAALQVWSAGLPFFLPRHDDRVNLLFQLLDGGDEGEDCQRRLNVLCLRMSEHDLLVEFVDGMKLVGPAAESVESAVPSPLQEEGSMVDLSLSAAGLRVESSTVSIISDGVIEDGTVGSEEAGMNQSPSGDSRMLEEEAEERVRRAAASGKSVVRSLSKGSSARAIRDDSLEATQQKLQVMIRLMRKLVDRIETSASTVLHNQRQPRRECSPHLKLFLSLERLLGQELICAGAGDADARGLELDSARKSDNISLSDDSRTVTQRKSKSWGCILAKQGFAPGTGIHQWIIHLGRCEKGHVFIGVCTAQASTSTYVGGDRHGWGLIGTRALWHNRSKIRGDYGDGFTSGSIVLVTLDTDKGTLSFSSKAGATGSVGTDWRVAFEGLPRKEMLYPAIGLYQLDDQVTVSPAVASLARAGSLSASPAPEACEAFDREATRAIAVFKPILDFIEDLTLRCSSLLQSLVDEESELNASPSLANHPLLTAALPAACASLLLMPRTPYASSLLSSHLLPVFAAAATLCDRLTKGRKLAVDMSGTWRIQSSAAESIPAQEYVLDLQTQLEICSSGEQSGLYSLTGTGEDGPSAVDVQGSLLGLHLSFTEIWRQGGTCIVEGRLGLDGSAFWGTYRDSRSGTEGSISGIRLVHKSCYAEGAVASQYTPLGALLAMAVGRFASTLILGVETRVTELPAASLLAANGMASDDEFPCIGADMGIHIDAQPDLTAEWRNSELLRGGLHVNEVAPLIATALRFYLPQTTSDKYPAQVQRWREDILACQSVVQGDNPSLPSVEFCKFSTDLMNLTGEAAEMDRWISMHLGTSPLIRVGGEALAAARRSALSAIVFHTGSLAHLASAWSLRQSDEDCPSTHLLLVWRAARQVAEWAVRTRQQSMMGPEPAARSTYAAIADEICRRANFLLSLYPCPAALGASEKDFLGDGGIGARLAAQTVQFLQSRIHASGLEALKRDMARSAVQTVFRAAGFGAFGIFVGQEGLQNPTLLTSTLQYLQPALQGRIPPLVSSTCSAWKGASGAGTFIDLAEEARRHFMDGISGVASPLCKIVRTAFERLYASLAGRLASSSWVGDSAAQLVLLQSWGLAISADDHIFLARVGIFSALQTVIEASRSAANASAVSSVNDISACEWQRVVRCALKVVHLLASQVAFGDAERIARGSASDDEASLSRGPALERTPSGPDTLSRSLFDTLRSELAAALLDLASADRASGGVTRVAAGQNGNEGKEEELTPWQYCYRVLSLIHSVSCSPTCQRFLIEPAWLSVLLRNVQMGPPAIQRRLLRLLHRLLPEVNPEGLSSSMLADYGCISGDGEVKGSSRDSFAEQVVRLLLQCIADSVAPPGPAAVLATAIQAEAEGGDGDQSKPLSEFQMSPAAHCQLDSLMLNSGSATSGRLGPESPSRGFTAPLATESVSLLRSLLCKPAWKPAVQNALLAAMHDCGTLLDAHISVAEDDITSFIMRPERHRFVTAAAAMGVLGGFMDGLHLGGLVTLRPVSLAGMSDALMLRLAAVSNTSALVVTLDEKAGGTAEVALVERDSSGRKDGQGPLSLSGGLPIRLLKMSCDDLVPVSMIDPPTQDAGNEAADAVFASLSSSGLQWLSSQEVSTMDIPEDLNHCKYAWDRERTTLRAFLAVQTFKAFTSLLSEPLLAQRFIGNKEGIVTLLKAAAAPMEKGGLGYLEKREELWLNSWDEWTCASLQRVYALLVVGGGADHTEPLGDDEGTDDSVEGTDKEAESDERKRRSQVSDGGENEGEDGGDMSAAAVSSSFASYITATAAALGVGTVVLDTSVAVAQMMEMGFPEDWCRVALRRCGNSLEQAVNFCFEHSSDMDHIIAEEQAISAAAQATQQGRGPGPSGGRRGGNLDSSLFMKQLLEMGFPPAWCAKALSANRNNVDAALTWILSNGESLAAEDTEGDSPRDRDSTNDSLEDGSSQAVVGAAAINPLQVVSGMADISKNLSAEGVPAGGFASVGSRGCLLTTGCWYYEATLLTNGCMQLGWADAAYRGNAENGDGVGDGPHSWAFDGWRQFKWHDGHVRWGAPWKRGDVVGCMVNLEDRTMSFTLNGRGEDIGMGLAFENFHASGGVFACASFNRREGLRFNFGGSPLQHGPPPGYRPYIEAIEKNIEQHSLLLQSLGLDQGQQDKNLPLYIEDCLEEEVGAESYTWHTRFFPSETSNSSSASSRAGRKAATTERRLSDASMPKRNLIAENPTELLAPQLTAMLSQASAVVSASRELCILYARQAILTLFSQWPTDTLKACLMSDKGSEDMAPTLVQVLALAAAELSGSSAPPFLASPPTFGNSSKGLPQRGISGLLMGGALTLNALTPAATAAVRSACQQGNSSLLSALTQCVSRQIAIAAGRQYAGFFSAPTSGRQQQRAPVGVSDGQAMEQPNLVLATWATSILLVGIQDAGTGSENLSLARHLFRAWSLSFMSPNVTLKLLGCTVVSAIVQDMAYGRLGGASEGASVARECVLSLPLSRLQAMALSRLWTERSSAPIYSRCLQGFVELFVTMSLVESKGNGPLCDGYDCTGEGLPSLPLHLPRPLDSQVMNPSYFREWDEGLVLSSNGWETWSGMITQYEIVWEKPSLPRRASSRRGESGGETPPPPLLPGCHVIKGPNWLDDYEEPQALAEPNEPTSSIADGVEADSDAAVQSSDDQVTPETCDDPTPPEDPSARVPVVVGVVEEIVELGGISGGGRLVRWPDGSSGVYRWGAEGALDLIHVEVNSGGSIRLRYPLPEIREEAVAACGFGCRMSWGVLLRIRPAPRPAPFYDPDGTSKDIGDGPVSFSGILEWPDFSASVAVEGERWGDGSMSFHEVSLLSGSSHCGWRRRFADSAWVPGTSYSLSSAAPTDEARHCFPSLLGSYSYNVELSGRKTEVCGDIRLSQSSLFYLDEHACTESIKVGNGGTMATCVGSESRCLVFGSVGFSSGVHYWEVKVAQGEPGCVYLGVAEKPAGGSRLQLGRWHGWGFVNYRATYHSNNERVYGEHFHSGDTVGVQLDMDKGVLSFFLDGMKYGEHITSDLGSAFEGLLGGRTRVSPRTLFPVFGFRKSGDRISLSQKWFSSIGAHPSALVEDACAVSNLLRIWEQRSEVRETITPALPSWFMREAWQMWHWWRSGRWYRTSTRASAGSPVDLDTSPRACIAASLLLGLCEPLFSGDIVEVSCSCGHYLETKETAKVLGAYGGRLFYRPEGQRGDAAAAEGANSAWCWAQCDIGSGIKLVRPSSVVPSTVRTIPLNLLSPYCSGWLRVVYEGEAVVRGGMEIDASAQVASLPSGCLVWAKERRISSTGVARYLVEHEGVEGWVSERICGGAEEQIMRRATMQEVRAERPDAVISAGAPDARVEGYTEVSLEVDCWVAAAIRAGGDDAANWLSGEGWAYRHDDLSLEEFASAADDAVWTVERDMLLGELVNDLATHCGTEPFNSSFVRLQAGLEALPTCVDPPSSPFLAVLQTSLTRTPGGAAYSSGGNSLDGIPPRSILARIAVLFAFNHRVGRALPLLSPALPEEDWQRHMLGSPGWSVQVKNQASPHPEPSSSKVQPPLWQPLCTARRLRRLRRLIFTHTKRSYWETLLRTTATPTPLHHDEYEDPREIRLIRMNRVKATPSRLGAIQNPSERLRHSVFGQLHREMRGWPNSTCRRAYVGKGHGGQKRAFKVKFLGEGVNDYGGPYRAVFEQVVDELQSDQLALPGRHLGDRCLLPLLIPCPNRVGHVGANQDQFLLSPGPVGSSPGSQELAQFLGKLVGMAVRHGLQMGLDLPAAVWRPLVGLSVGPHQLEAIDLLAEKLLKDVEASGKALESGELSEPPAEWAHLTMTTHLSDLREVSLVPGGSCIPVTRENWREFVSLTRLRRLQESSTMLRALREGLSAVLPVEVFPLFTPMELERLICGVPSVDVDLLKQCTEYDCVDPDSPHVQAFWEVLQEMQPEERTAFLRFVWARSRMPSSANDFPMSFKIQAPQGGAHETPDSYLPHAQTCFFSLSLPAYSSKEVLRQKLLFAINNSPNMDADVRLHSAEGWADT